MAFDTVDLIEMLPCYLHDINFLALSPYSLAIPIFSEGLPYILLYQNWILGPFTLNVLMGYLTHSNNIYYHLEKLTVDT